MGTWGSRLSNRVNWEIKQSVGNSLWERKQWRLLTSESDSEVEGISGGL